MRASRDTTAQHDRAGKRGRVGWKGTAGQGAKGVTNALVLDPGMGAAQEVLVLNVDELLRPPDGMDIRLLHNPNHSSQH